jgi:hypothetical protein
MRVTSASGATELDNEGAVRGKRGFNLNSRRRIPAAVLIPGYNRRMAYELHILIRPGVNDLPEDILADFPFEAGQSILTYSSGTVIIDLGGADDSNYVQDWYLNSNDDVQSYYVVED